MIAALAYVLMLTSMIVVYLGWRNSGAHARVFTVFACSIAVASSLILAGQHGAEFGITYALLFITPLAWVCVLQHMQIRTPNHSDARPYKAVSVRPSKVVNNTFNFIVVFPVTGVACVLACTHLAHAVGLGMVNAIAAVILVFPLLWGLLAYVYCASTRQAWLGSAIILTAGSLSFLTFT